MRFAANYPQASAWWQGKKKTKIKKPLLLALGMRSGRLLGRPTCKGKRADLKRTDSAWKVSFQKGCGLCQLRKRLVRRFSTERRMTTEVKFCGPLV